MKVSLVLATVGRCDELRRCIESLMAQTTRDFELLVVDQNDDDRLMPFLNEATKAGLDVKHLKLRPPNLSAARNLGILQASGEIVGFPDDDCWYEATTVANAAAQFARDCAPGGVVGDWVEQSTQNGGKTQVAELSLRAWRNFRGGSASSVSLFLHRSVFDAIGLFDARFGVGQWYGAGEETDLVLRVLEGGIRLKRAPEVRVHHAVMIGHAQHPVSMIWSRARKRARGTGALYVKHRLDAVVIARGLLSPLALSLVRWDGWRRIVERAAIVVGRSEGMIRWACQSTPPTISASRSSRYHGSEIGR